MKGLVLFRSHYGNTKQVAESIAQQITALGHEAIFQDLRQKLPDLQGLLALFMGRLTDRFGPRQVVVVAAVFLTAGYLLMSRLGTIWQLYLFYGVIIGVGMSATWIPLLSTVARWFVKGRGLMTGVEMDGDYVMKVGERVFNVEKAFNIREGVRRKDDTLPQKFFIEKVTQWGTTGINQTKFQAMLDEYYQARGWNKEGIPTRKKLDELNLGYIAGQIGAV